MDVEGHIRPGDDFFKVLRDQVAAADVVLVVMDEAEADRLFAALADGGQVQMPLGATFFARRFGMVADKFGVGWMIIVKQ